MSTNDEQLLIEAYKKIYENQIGKGNHFEATLIGPNKVRKTPISGETIPNDEYEKLKFMLDNQGPDKPFIRIWDLTSDWVETEEVQLVISDLYDFSSWFIEETNDGDELSDNLLKFFSNKSNWKDNLESMESYKKFLIQSGDTGSDVHVLNHIISLFKRMLNVKNWPEPLDIHAHNIGVTNDRKLVIFDM